KSLEVENAGQHGTDNTGHAVYAENVEAVICVQHTLEPAHTPDADCAGKQADDKGTTRANQACCRGDTHQTRHCAGDSTQKGSVPLDHALNHQPCQYTARSCEQGVEESQCHRAGCAQCGASVEAEPAHPQQRSTNHG